MDETTKVDMVEGNRRLMLMVGKLREVQETEPDRFHYASWVGRDWKGMEDLSCGTTACAAGWATTVPELAELGLYMQKDRVRTDGTVIGSVAVRNVSTYSHHALEQFFGLTYTETDHLFYPEGDEREMSAGQVADRVEAFIARRAAGAVPPLPEEWLAERDINVEDLIDSEYMGRPSGDEDADE